jgi:hypothetical protein
MALAWILANFASVFAGVGIKWGVDRVWPPPPRVIEIPAPEPRPRGGGPRLTALDDTMDVLGAGIDVGVKIGRHHRPPSVLEQLGVPAGVALSGGGWNSGACLDGPPTERSADYPHPPETLGETYAAEFGRGPQAAPSDGWAGLS